MNDSPRPPRLPQLLLSLLVPEEYREDQLGDIDEGFARRAGDLTRARFWYTQQVARSIIPALRLRFRIRGDRTYEARHTSRKRNFMGTLFQDLRYGLRSMRRSPLFAVVSTLTLALAIGVNTAIFSIVSTIIFADLPMQDPDGMALVRGVNGPLGIDQGSMTAPEFFELRQRANSFESMTALTGDQWVVTGNDLPLRVTGMRTTANMFEVWNLPPIHGRSFAPGEDQVGAAPVVMLAYPFWQSRYGGEDVVGRTIRLDGVEHTIIGVTDPKLGFANFGDAEIWAPLILDPNNADGNLRNLFVSGRLLPGVTHAQATQEVDAIGKALAEQYPQTNAGWELWSAPVMESLLDDDGRTIMLMLMLTVGFVILIACANVANMLLARATSRARELSVRTALGAGRSRLIRQLLTESLVISLAAAALGVAFAKGLNTALVRISNGQEVVFEMAQLDGRTLGFTLLVSLLAPLIFGLFPALQASNAPPGEALNEGRGADGARRGKSARGFLVGAQVSLALALMVVAGLLVRSVQQIQARELGYEPADLMAVGLDLPENSYATEDARRQFYTQALETVEALPGARGATLISMIPGAGFGALRSIDVQGRPIPEGQARPSVNVVTVSEGWSELLEIPLISGRRLGPEDGPDAPQVAVIGRDVGVLYWPDQDPVGQRIRLAEDQPWIEIVGVVGDVRATSDEQRPAAHLYRPYAQVGSSATNLVVKAGGDPVALAASLRQAVWSVDANQPIDRVETVDQALYNAAASTYALLTLFVSFAVLALIMAAIGIYGVMSYSVSQRKAELGLRMALGAEVGQVERMVVLQGSKLVAVGIVVGLVAAFLLSRLLGGVVYGISATDPVTFVGVPAVLALVALVANYLPARAATRGDPLAALRSD